MNIANFRDQIELIKSKAFRRAGFVQKYKEISASYSALHMEPRDERKLALKKIDDTLIILDDLSNNLVNIIGNPVTQSDPKLKNDTRQLNEKIKNVQIILEQVIKCQSSFLYLEPIFNTNEINKALGCKPEWNPNPNARDKTITLQYQTDLSDPIKVEESIDWLVKQTIVFRDVFAKEVKNIKA